MLFSFLRGHERCGNLPWVSTGHAAGSLLQWGRVRLDAETRRLQTPSRWASSALPARGRRPELDRFHLNTTSVVKGPVIPGAGRREGSRGKASSPDRSRRPFGTRAIASILEQAPSSIASRQESLAESDTQRLICRVLPGVRHQGSVPEDRRHRPDDSRVERVVTEGPGCRSSWTDRSGELGSRAGSRSREGGEARGSCAWRIARGPWCQAAELNHTGSPGVKLRYLPVVMRRLR